MAHRLDRLLTSIPDALILSSMATERQEGHPLPQSAGTTKPRSIANRLVLALLMLVALGVVGFYAWGILYYRAPTLPQPSAQLPGVVGATPTLDFSSFESQTYYTDSIEWWHFYWEHSANLDTLLADSRRTSRIEQERTDWQAALFQEGHYLEGLAEGIRGHNVPTSLTLLHARWLNIAGQVDKLTSQIRQVTHDEPTSGEAGKRIDNLRTDLHATTADVLAVADELVHYSP